MQTSDILNCKKRLPKRISVWVIVFSLIILTFISAFTVNAHAKNLLDDTKNAAGDVRDGIGEAVSDVGDAVSDVADGVGDAVSDATSDMMDPDAGKVSDNDGIIGNEGSETQDGAMSTSKKSGWIALAIAIAVVVAVIILIVALVPRKKK